MEKLRSGPKFASPLKVAAMETLGSDPAIMYPERDCDLEHLPPLLEDEENVSLADILSLRDNCLSEEEVWAVCAECIQALQSIRPSHLFHSLCITPDTLAFNAHGNVCFMEQLSDDPEGSFVPPEFDSTGSTFEGHVFSLGSTLSAALNFVIEPELEAELGEEIQRLLQQMQEENPEDRPLVQDILALAKAWLSHSSSAVVCRKLSSIGRRVLSIESVSTFQDGPEHSWEARWQHPKPRCLFKRLNSDDNGKDLFVDNSVCANGLSRQQVCRGWDSTLWAEDVDEGGVMILADDLDCRSHNSSPVRRTDQQRLNRVRGALNRSCSVPDSNNPPYLSPPSHGDISVPLSNLTEIGADERLDCKSAWSDKLQRLNRGQSCESYPQSSTEDTTNSALDNLSRGNEDNGETKIHASQSCVQDSTFEKTDQSLLMHSLYIPNNHMTKSMLCLNEESQDEWISLRDLLTRCGRRLTVNELWALCYICLSSLQTYTDFPAYLCLDTVHVGCQGDILFLQPRKTGTRDEFYLAPEYQEHGIVTEKACVYGIAAILWATAKFSLSPNQKLAMPRKLKRLLLEMAKTTPIERPTIVMAKKVCRDYLSYQGTNAETVWKNLVSRAHLTASNNDDLSSPESQKESDGKNSGFVPMATESRLAPVPGPVPHSYPVKNELPENFTSIATHFSPIILTDEDEEERSQHTGAAMEGTADGFTTNQPNPYMEPGSQAAVGATSSHRMLLSSASLKVTQHECTNFKGCAVFNNYLFHQDPKTERPLLMPVLCRAPDSFHGLHINLSLVPEISRGQGMNGPNVSVRPTPQDCITPSSYFEGTTVVSELERNDATAYIGQKDPATQGPTLPKIHPAFKDVIGLLNGESSLSGFLDSGHEGGAMGEYIFSLKYPQYHTFAHVVKETLGNLYWDEDLLGLLHCLVNNSPGTLSSKEQPPSKLTQPLVATAWGGKRGVCLHGCLDLNGNIYMPRGAEGFSWEGTEAQSCNEEDKMENLELGSRGSQRCITQGTSTNSSDTGVMERGDYSVGGHNESPSEAEFPVGSEEVLTEALCELMGPDRLEDMKDGGTLVSERFTIVGSRLDGLGLSFSPGWALALFGEDCFSPEVIQYAADLGQHTGSACVDVKMQELQQQLIIETRNLKKTKTFCQKLIQQERKSQGCENKSKLCKLKSHFEELRSKVLFLECVKKYLEILSVEQWGLDVSLLPSLAVCGHGSLTLQSSEDSSVLSFGTSKGKHILQAGSPLGLMAYLYARNAAMGGFIHQYLYTYRFFCTPEQLLQFIMDKFICAVRQGSNMSGDNEKIFHRSLDLLHLWITDCRQVDFKPNSSIVNMLENFLNTEVIPADSRGEALLAALQAPLCTTRSQRRESLISFEEDEDSSCLYTSTEDLGRKWRFSRVVEPSVSLPKEKAFSIAAALPVPSYSALMDDLSTNEEQLPFSQNEHSAQHIAQQLTLLQQEMFQRCHPVHFLNTRTQGVRDKVSARSKNISHVPPAEGSSPPACKEMQSDSYLQQLLTYADSVSNWISAEIIICDSVKAQVALLTKYLLVGKHCYETRNFATAMQVLCGLENVIVRQLPAWKHLSSKACEILEELRAVQVFLKSDDLCLMRGDHTRGGRPTLPSVHILAMHVQQLEIGALTLTTGAYKWNKLRSIAKVVSQVHAFQETVCHYSPDWGLQAYLRHRIAQLAASDVNFLATDSDASFQQSSERQTRRIQEKLRKVKANFH